LGMDGRSGSIRISLRGCLLNAATENVTVGIRIRLVFRFS
jgi:hypothetical protein